VLLTEPRRRSPLSIGAIVDLALEAYGGDARFYLSLAVCAFVVQAVVGLPLGGSAAAQWWLQGLNLIADAFLAGCVSIGVAARLREEPLSAREIVERAVRRWWAIVAVDLVVWFVRALTFDFVFGSVEATGYYTMTLPTLVVWGTFLSADVIAAIDERTPLPALPGYALWSSLMLSWRRGNLARVTLLSIMTVPALMLPMVLDDVLRLHAIVRHDFWSSIPVDALLTGPYQALFTVFYLDLRNRTDRAQ